MPLAIVEPTAGERQLIRIAVAKKGVRQLNPPNTLPFRCPGRNPLRAFDEDLLSWGRPVLDAVALARAATNGLDPFPISPTMDDHDIARLRHRRGLVDGEIRVARAARRRVAPGRSNVDFPGPKATRRHARAHQDHQCQKAVGILPLGRPHVFNPPQRTRTGLWGRAHDRFRVRGVIGHVKRPLWTEQTCRQNSPVEKR